MSTRARISLLLGTLTLLLGGCFVALDAGGGAADELSGDGGQVDIAWGLEPSGRIRFVWEEQGGPAVAPPVRRGFGSRLIQEGLARELNGEVTMDYLPEGLRCELSFQLDRAEQEGLDPSFKTDADVI